MPQINNFPAGFSAGLTIRGMPIAVSHPGKVFWLNNGTVLSDRQIGGSDSNNGTFDKPFSTLTGALAATTAGRGDIIMVKPGHAETIGAAAGVVLSKAGVAIIGLGTGAQRPTFTWSLATSTITVTASQVSIQNCVFLGGAATTFVATAFSVASAVVAKDLMIDNCEFRDVDATHGFISALVQGGTTANALDGLTFSNNKVFRILTSPPAANTAVVLTAAHDRVNFSDNYIVNTTANNNIALGIAFGANSQTNLMIARNRTQSLNTGTTAGELFSGGSTASSGLVWDNYSWHLASTGLLGPVSTKLGFVQNFCSITGAADKSALINPVAV